MTNHDHMHNHDHNHDHMSSDHMHDHDHMRGDHMHDHMSSDHMKSDHMSGDHMHDHDHMTSDQIPNHDHKMQDNDHDHKMQDQGSKSTEMKESNELEVTTKRIKTKKKSNQRNRTGRRFGRQRLNSLPFNFRIPQTGFSCKGRAPGYYADMEADCTVT